MRLSDHMVRYVTDEDYAKRMFRDRKWLSVVTSCSFFLLLLWALYWPLQLVIVIRLGPDDDHWLWCQTSGLCIIVISLLFLLWEASVMEDLNPKNSHCCQWFNRSRATTWCDLGLESLWIKQRRVKNTNRLNCLCLSSSQVSSSCVPATNYELVSNCFFSLFFSFFFLV